MAINKREADLGPLFLLAGFLFSLEKIAVMVRWKVKTFAKGRGHCQKN